VSEERTLANVGALGLGGFALSTFILNIVNAGWVDAKTIGIVMPVAMFYGGLAQFMAGMWDVKRGDTFGATCFSSFGAFWMGLATFFFLKLAGVAGFVDVTPAGVAIVLIAWGIFTFYATIASLKLPKEGGHLGVHHPDDPVLPPRDRGVRPDRPHDRRIRGGAVRVDRLVRLGRDPDQHDARKDDPPARGAEVESNRAGPKAPPFSFSPASQIR